jgi:hypothetical protein
VHRVIELDPRKIPKDLHAPEIPQRFLKQSGATEPSLAEPQATTTVAVIDVLVAYTKNAKTDSPNILSEINLAISLTNTAYKNSGVLSKLRLVGTREVIYNEARYGGNTNGIAYTKVLCDLTGFNCASIFGSAYNNNATATFNAVRTARTALKADLVVLIRRQGAACGNAWVPFVVSAGSQHLGFSTVTRDYGCINGNTFAHEIGHNQGLHHDRFVEPAAPNTKYNYGYVDATTAGHFRDIMSYPNKCPSCTRVPYFSTPLKKYKTKLLGIAQGKPGAADATRSLNEVRNIIGAYR